MAFRGMAEANGWLERAEQLLERIPEPSADLGLYLYCRANYALKVDHDPRSAAEFASSSVALARLGGAVDGEMASLALEGLALVAAGRVGEGMRRLDQATAAAVVGEISDVRLVEVVCCHLIDACKRVRDFDRAGEWCRRVQEISERYDDAEMFATCRTEYADLLIWQGAWADAEDVLRAACRELGRVPRREADGLVKLAELRRRQRRIREALALLDEAGGHRHAALVRAAIALDGGDPPAAAEHAERFLRRAGGEDTFERVPALELLVRARLALGEHDEAERAAAELERTAASVWTAPLRAAAVLARGRVQAAGQPELARGALEDAADLLQESGAGYEAAFVRLEHAAVLRVLGREQAASEVETAARRALESLGVGDAGEPEAELLTRREREVLRLVAAGRSNEQIAATLVLSVRTVERHVANIYVKIGASGRSARAAATAWAIGHGVA